MPKQYRLTFARRIVNLLAKFGILLGFAPRGRYLLTVRGRKSGKLYSTPVTLVQKDKQRWLVSPYGVVNWVHNVRITHQAALSRRGISEDVSLTEIAPDQCAPILKAYLALEPVTQPFFDAAPAAPVEAFAKEASRHPVFEVVPIK